MATSPSGLGEAPSGEPGAWDDVPEPDGRWSDLGPWAAVPGASGTVPGPGDEDDDEDEDENGEEGEGVSPLAGMTVAELRDELAELGLPTSGTKAELIERLEAAE